ncbi:MAG: tetratricopeptide repeat protein [Deltaproteobacteria bacterium]|nr:tetratricopeptide repeat protein [Deltaproteobacteria bacterium]
MIAVPPMETARGRAWPVAGKQSQSIWLLAAVMLLAIVPYLNALSDGFTLDDEPQILTNPVVHGGVDPIGILASPLFPGDLYRPLTTFTFAVNQTLSPDNPSYFHAANLVLHAAVTLLLFWLSLRLFRRTSAAVIAAALFALHPLHTEAVTSLVGRAEELAALFGLLSLLAALRIDETGDAWTRRGWHALSVVAFIGAITSKESGLTVLPLILLARPALRGESLWRGSWNELRRLDWVPYALCVALFLHLRGYVTGGLLAGDTVTPLESMLAFVPTGLRVRTALAVVWDYVSLMHFPLVLSADYSTSQVAVVETWWSPSCIAGLVLLVAGTAVVLFAKRRTVAFATALPIVTFSLTSNLLFPVGTAKAERLVYMPSIGWALLAGLAFDWCLRQPRYRRVGAVALAAMLATFSIRTWVRNRDWADNATLHQSSAASSPRSAKAHYNYAVALQNDGNQQAALFHYRRAIEIYPWSEGAVLGIGIAYEKSGDMDRATAWYRRALALSPSFMRAHSDLCRALFVRQRYVEAEHACRDGLRYEPANANLLKGLGGSLFAAGEREMGMTVLRRALRLNPADGELERALAEMESAPANHAEAGGVG